MPNKLHKPARWALTRGLVDPKWAWFWGPSTKIRYAMWAGGGTKVVNLAHPGWFDGTVGSGLDSSAWGNEGRIIKHTSGAANSRITTGALPVDLGISGANAPFTFFIQHKATEDISITSWLFALGTKASDQMLGLALLTFTNVLEYKVETWGTNLTGPTVNILNSLEKIVFTYDGDELIVWRNGENYASVSGLTLTLGTQTSLEIGHWSQRNDSESRDTELGLFGLDSRAWSSTEVAQWSADSFGPLRMRDDVGVVFALPVAAVGAFKPPSGLSLLGVGV